MLEFSLFPQQRNCHDGNFRQKNRKVSGNDFMHPSYRLTMVISKRLGKKAEYQICRHTEKYIEMAVNYVLFS